MVVLIVDDDEDDREMFCEALQRIDPLIKSINMNDGTEALNYLNQATSVCPDFIFMDVNMPKMDGKECLNLIKSHPSYTDIVVIMLSTTQSTQEITLFKNQGVQFLTKPTSIAELIESLKKILKKID